MSIGSVLIGESPPVVITGSTQNLSTIRSGAGTIQSITMTTSTSGGVAPYTYAWTTVSGSTVTINTPTASSTSFTVTLSMNESKNTIVRCTVTDAFGTTGSCDVELFFLEISYNGYY